MKWSRYTNNQKWKYIGIGHIYETPRISVDFVPPILIIGMLERCLWRLSKRVSCSDMEDNAELESIRNLISWVSCGAALNRPCTLKSFFRPSMRACPGSCSTIDWAVHTWTDPSCPSSWTGCMQQCNSVRCAISMSCSLSYRPSLIWYYSKLPKRHLT